jgi:hypothetical protein
MISGVVMIFVSPEGRVLAHAADFGQERLGGYTVEEAQSMRCRRELEVAAFRALASQILVDGTDDHIRERVLAKLEPKGYRRHSIVVEVPQ